MSFWINFGILVCVIVTMVIGVIIVVIRYGKEEEYLDEPMILNWMSHHCEGRFIGVQKKVELGKEGRKIITMSPRDINPHFIDKVKDVPIVVDKNKDIPLPKGVCSNDKNVIMVLPPTVEDFPPGLKETPFGKMLMFYTSITNASNAEVSALQEGMKRQEAHIKSMAAGEVSTERMTQMQEIFDDLLKSALQAKKDKFSSSGSLMPPR